MPTARDKLITCRLAEHLVCAELARRGFIATTFTHNVPVYDILATDIYCRTVPIQVKATNEDKWRTDATKWMNIKFSRLTKTQQVINVLRISMYNPVWICVAVGKKRKQDQFFILAEDDLQHILHSNYKRELERWGGRKPRRWKSVDCWWSIEDVTEFRNRWDVICNRVSTTRGEELAAEDDWQLK